MKIELVGIEAVGVLAQERVVLRVKEDTDLGNYTVLRSWIAGQNSVQSGAMSEAYWFNNKELKKGDYVILYSKSGEDRQKDIGESRTSYFFYWGRDEPIWDEDRAPVLLEAPEWATLAADEATVEPAKQGAEPKVS